MKTTATRNEVMTAIENVNNEHGYSLSLNRDDQTGKWFNFTLNSPSKVAGAKVSHSGRNIAKASWHAHGYVMDEILRLTENENAVIQTMAAKVFVDHETGDVIGNWQDYNVGSVFSPMYASEGSIL